MLNTRFINLLNLLRDYIIKFYFIKVYNCIMYGYVTVQPCGNMLHETKQYVTRELLWARDGRCDRYRSLRDKTIIRRTHADLISI